MPLALPSSLSSREQRRRRQLLAVDADGVALLEADADLGRLVGRVHRRDGALIDDRRRFLRRVLQHLALGGRVQQVGVDRERRLALLVLGDRNLVLARELQQVLAALEAPFAPRRDDLDRRIERVIGQLEADLVVALAGRAMTDRVGADLVGDLDLLLGDQRPRDRGAEQVLPLVQRVGAEHREHVVADELLAQVLDEDVLRLDAEQQRLLARRRELLALAEVGGEGHDLAAIGGLQPLQDDRGVEPAGIGEHDLLDVAFRHDARPSVKIRADYRGNAGGRNTAPSQKETPARVARALQIRSDRGLSREWLSRRPARAGAPRRRDSRPTPARRGSSSRTAAAERRKPAPAGVVARLRRRGAEDGADREAADNTGRHRAAVAARLGGSRQDRRAHGRSRHQNDQTPGHD